jgi:hypothetical protein
MRGTKRHKVQYVWIALGCLVWTLVPLGSMAQNARMTLGSGQVSTGKTVGLPLYVTLPGDVSLGRITTIVKYPKDLKFQKTELGKDAKAGETLFDSKALPPDADGSGRLELTLTAASGKALPTGLVGTVFFFVSEKAQSRMVALPLVEAKGFSREGGAEVSLRGDPGEITIYEAGKEPQPTPMLGCFFFTH